MIYNPKKLEIALFEDYMYEFWNALFFRRKKDYRLRYFHEREHVSKESAYQNVENSFDPYVVRGVLDISYLLVDRINRELSEPDPNPQVIKQLVCEGDKLLIHPDYPERIKCLEAGLRFIDELIEYSER